MRTLLKDKLRHIIFLSLLSESQFKWGSVKVEVVRSAPPIGYREELYREETGQSKNFIRLAIS